jgi:IS1 family transposase
MNKLSIERQTQIVKALCEGSSIRSTARMVGVAVNTVVKLLTELGPACLDYQDKVMHDLPLRRIQCDEIWSFVYSKQKNVPEDSKGKLGVGDVWTFVAIDGETKLVPCWLVGLRDAGHAFEFINDLRERLANRVQLTTDGHKMYLSAVEGAFGANVDYAMLVKIYGPSPEGEKRYSPAECIAAEKHTIQGNPDLKHVSTSYVERQNLTMRMTQRRFTRLTNAFSKKLQNHEYDIALHFMWYNFARPHKSLSKLYATTPAMAAGLTDHVWDAKEVLSLLAQPK